MFHRTHIVITGPPTAGKTTFIERILSSNRSRSIDGMRWRGATGLEPAREVPGGDEDTERFYIAGADMTSLLLYPLKDLSGAADPFNETKVMLSVQDGILHETDEAIDISQVMTVLIVRPEGEFGAAFEQLMIYGLGCANLVIFNVDSAETRDLAEKLEAAIDLIRTQEHEQWKRMRTRCDVGVRITTRIIDLGDPRDAELKRAVESVKRKLPTDSYLGFDELDDLLRCDLPETVQSVLRVKVTLEIIDPPVWRRLLLPVDCTFWDLHVAIQDCMGWTDSCPHVFDLVGTETSGPLRIGLPDPHGDNGIIPGWTQEVLEHLPPHSGVSYTYDFCEKWEHWVEIERVEPETPGRSYPACISGARRCPPEGSGGLFNYPVLLDAIENPDHKDHAELLKVCGGNFDPEEFNPALVRFRDPHARLKWPERHWAHSVAGEADRASVPAPDEG